MLSEEIGDFLVTRQELLTKDPIVEREAFLQVPSTLGAAYASVVIVPDRLGLDASAKLAALFGVILIVNSSLLVLGAFLARLLRHPRSGRAINLLFALLLVLSVVMAASI